MLSFGEKIAKIGPADPKIICLWEIIKEKKKEINASNKYSFLWNTAYHRLRSRTGPVLTTTGIDYQWE